MEPLLSDNITFVCISDTHTKTYNLSLPSGDVLIHAGDFTSIGVPEEVDAFNEYLSKQNFQYKVVIAGNHDVSFDEENYEKSLKIRFHCHLSKMKTNPESFTSKIIKSKLKDCIYLEDSGCEVLGFKIYGSPWSPTFYDWGFNMSRGEKILEKWKKIPDNTDIVITHGPPHKILDRCYDGYHAGCEDLLKEIKTRIKPKAHIFGHIHEGYGEVIEDGIKFINASICTLSYRPSNKPIVFTLPRKKL